MQMGMGWPIVAEQGVVNGMGFVDVAARAAFEAEEGFVLVWICLCRRKIIQPMATSAAGWLRSIRTCVPFRNRDRVCSSVSGMSDPISAALKGRMIRSGYSGNMEPPENKTAGPNIGPAVQWGKCLFGLLVRGGVVIFTDLAQGCQHGVKGLAGFTPFLGELVGDLIRAGLRPTHEDHSHPQIVES
jgi:hypothetical protein